MDRAITASEANRSFSELLRQVEHGETVAVTKHGRVVARIIPSEMTEAIARTRRAAAMRTLLALMADRPVMGLGRITRDDGYD